MNGSLKPIDYYTQRVIDGKASLLPHYRKRRFLGWARLIMLLAAGATLWYAITFSLSPLILVSALLFGGFLFALSADLDNDKKILNKETLVLVTEEEIRIAAHDFYFRPTGEGHFSKEHDYANDLDILGHASLFQYINRSESTSGQKNLVQWLLHPAPVELIRSRQDAVKELATNPEWRAQFQSYGRLNQVTLKTEIAVSRWLAEGHQFLNHKFYVLLRWILPILSLGNLLAYLTGNFTSQQFYPLLFLFFILSLLISRKVMPAYVQLNKVNEQFTTLSHCIGHLEELAPRSTLLTSYIDSLHHGQEKSSTIISRLRKIMDRLDYRLNPLVFLPLNTLLFWDLQQIFALEKWKSQYGKNALSWFRVYGEMEALSSLATIRFNHPDWAFPVIVSEEGVFRSTELGHPLIPAGKRVNSSIEVSGKGQLALITGSNMAGKSTFLRSVGINTILAMSGAPVCAGSLEVSPLRVMSSMRVSDNLEESTSTFYAELKKLKTIIEAVNRKENILILLDEILRGTNSGDRHQGSAALIRQLIHHQATGLIATHDLELASLTKEFPGHIHNYHFDVQVEGEELFFDYKLKTGVCTSMNASLLMRKIGIEM
ncbi:MAG: hypothetical protein J0M30_12165 [Chitinophagales bacterium]|nr:hypothetical protein [Chitinophagales bacterium]